MVSLLVSGKLQSVTLGGRDRRWRAWFLSGDAAGFSAACEYVPGALCQGFPLVAGRLRGNLLLSRALLLSEAHRGVGKRSSPRAKVNWVPAA
jgi:hypothetical protein